MNLAFHYVPWISQVYLNFRKIHRKTPVLESLLNKVAGLTIATLLKVSPTQVFSFEFGKIFENIYFAQHLRTATSESILMIAMY